MKNGQNDSCGDHSTPLDDIDDAKTRLTLACSAALVASCDAFPARRKSRTAGMASASAMMGTPPALTELRRCRAERPVLNQMEPNPMKDSAPVARPAIASAE
jgi:hypothetical protein